MRAGRLREFDARGPRVSLGSYLRPTPPRAPAQAAPGCRSARRCRTAARPATRRRGCCCSPRRARGATRQLGAVGVVAPAVRDAHDARHDRVGHLDRDLDRPGARAHARRPAVGQPEAARRRRGGRAACSAPGPSRAGQVVHPGVVGAQLAAADQHDARRSARAPATPAAAPRRPRSAPAPARSCRSACAAPRAAAARAAPRSMPCGRSSLAGQPSGRPKRRRRARRAAAGRASARARGAARQLREQLVGVAARDARPRRRDSSRSTSPSATMSSKASTSASAPWPATIAGQPQQRLPLGRLPSARRSKTGGE